MNLNPQRPWITPLVIGTFVVMAATGVLMFFHVDSGLNKTAHEWLGWAMLVAVALHMALHLNTFKRYFSQTIARWVMLLCATVLVLSFFSWGQAASKPSFVRPMQSLANAPLATLAQVAGISPKELRTRLAAKGIQSQSDQQSVKELVGSDLGEQMRTLNKAFGS